MAKVLRPIKARYGALSWTRFPAEQGLVSWPLRQFQGASAPGKGKEFVPASWMGEWRRVQRHGVRAHDATSNQEKWSRERGMMKDCAQYHWIFNDKRMCGPSP